MGLFEGRSVGVVVENGQNRIVGHAFGVDYLLKALPCVVNALLGRFQAGQRAAELAQVIGGVGQLVGHLADLPSTALVENNGANHRASAKEFCLFAHQTGGVDVGALQEEEGDPLDGALAVALALRRPIWLDVVDQPLFIAVGIANRRYQQTGQVTERFVVLLRVLVRIRLMDVVARLWKSEHRKDIGCFLVTL